MTHNNYSENDLKGEFPSEVRIHKKSNINDDPQPTEDDYEYVSTETVEELVLWSYKVLLRLSFFVRDVTSLYDIKATIKSVIALVIIWQISNFMSDSAYLWIISNIVLTHPLYYTHKRAEIDRVIGLVNLQVDNAIDKLSFLKLLERKPAGETKKT